MTWGSATAATLWLGASALFAVYVRAFANYSKTYGALGAVIALLMWFYVSSVIVVLGAEINAEMERQTKADTTEGPAEPMGQRGAYAADTIGPAVLAVAFVTIGGAVALSLAELIMRKWKGVMAGKTAPA